MPDTARRAGWAGKADRAGRTVAQRALWCAAALLAFVATATLAAQSPKYGVGRPPTREEILALGSAIAPDGTGLPDGSGTVAAGRDLFAARCSRCHGPDGEGDVGPRLVGGQGTLKTP